MSEPMTIRPLTEADVPGALRLSTQAGWNQLAEDWRRLIALWPDGCVGGWVEGRLVATGTLATFGRSVGWVGMILVDEAERGRGRGGAIFEATLKLGDTLGIARLGLDATDLGRPVYLKRGFVDQVGIDRWAGSVRGDGEDAKLTRAMAAADRDAVHALDAAAVGVDRSALLDRLAGEPGATGRVVADGDRMVGYGFSRRGRTAGMIGPLVTADHGAAAGLLDALLADRAADGDERVIVDVLRGAPVEAALRGRGFEVKRKLTRMVRPAAETRVLAGPRVCAGAGFELG